MIHEMHVMVVTLYISSGKPHSLVPGIAGSNSLLSKISLDCLSCWIVGFCGAEVAFGTLLLFDCLVC